MFVNVCRNLVAAEAFRRENTVLALDVARWPKKAENFQT